MKHHQFQRFLHYQKGKSMSDMMTFPNTVEEFMEQYKIIDTEKIYTNGAEVIPIFRMMQWFEHVSATDKNVSTTDTISRQAAIDLTIGLSNDSVDFVRAGIKALPPAQPEIIRCKDCKHHWTHKCMDSMPIEGCDLEQIFYDAEHDFYSLAERRTDDQRRSNQTI